MPARLLFVFFVAITVACHQPDERRVADDAHIVGPSEIPLHSDWNDRALLLAGMPVSSEFGSRPEVQGILSRPSYRYHQQLMEGLWKSVEARRLRPIRAWREKNLHGRIPSRTALYPLSGGDFLNLNLLYPDADRYLMIAMEKPGQIPDPAAMPELQLSNGLMSVGQMLANIAQTGYFWSHFMNTHMNPESKGIFGTMPTVSVFLVRLGHTIQDVQRSCLTDAGQLEVFVAAPTGVCRVPGYRIRFRDGQSGASKELIYLSTKIDASLFDTQSPEGRFFGRIQHASVMLKAAIYLLHMPKNRPVAEYLLDHADVVIQDDSGLPFRYFESTRWNVELYGTFIAPPRLSDLDFFPQPDLAQAFKERGRDLPFDFGYGQIEPTKRSGMLVAFKK